MWRVPDADNNVKRTSWQTSYLTSAPLMPTVSMPGAAGSFCPGTSMRTPVYILNGSWGMVLILSFPVIYLSEMMGGTEPTGPWVDEVTPHCDTHTGPIRVGLAQNTKAHKQKKVLHSKMCAKKEVCHVKDTRIRSLWGWHSWHSSNNDAVQNSWQLTNS